MVAKVMICLNEENVKGVAKLAENYGLLHDIKFVF